MQPSKTQSSDQSQAPVDFLYIGSTDLAPRTRRSNLPGGAESNRRNGGLRRLSELLSSFRKRLRKDFRYTGGGFWCAGVLFRIQFFDLCRIRLCAGANVPDDRNNRDVCSDALVALCAGFSTSCVLPVLFVLRRPHIFADWPRCRPSAFALSEAPRSPWAVKCLALTLRRKDVNLRCSEVSRSIRSATC